jgi:hypothetical protein
MSEEKFPGKIKISLPTAQEWVKKYKEPKLEAKSKKIDAYLIPLESLQKVVRAYKGINELGEETLMFVGTVLNASTGIYEDVFPQAFNNEVASETEIVYDGGRPCPPYGDPNSPMNT